MNRGFSEGGVGDKLGWMEVRARACVRVCVQGSQIIRNPIIPEGTRQAAADLLHKDRNGEVFFIRS